MSIWPTPSRVLLARREVEECSCWCSYGLAVLTALCTGRWLLTRPCWLLTRPCWLPQVASLDDSCLAPVVAGCPELEQLELVQLEVGDALLALLAQHCSGLQVLRLEQTYASDAGVAAVVKVGMHVHVPRACLAAWQPGCLATCMLRVIGG